MNGILGMAQLLLMSGVSEDEQREYARTILNSGQTLLSLLWFVKDPAEAVENMKQQKQENQQQYMDSFAAKAEDKADEKGQSADQEQQDKEKDA